MLHFLFSALCRPGRVSSPGRAGAAALVLLLAGCTAVPPGAEFHDPLEDTNRKVHAFNRGVDKALLRPSSQAYGSAVPGVFKRTVDNVAGNLSQPGYMLNDVLQGRIDDAGHNGFRFLINSTIGLGGLFNPADSFGLPARESDFGETLHVWGAQEGAYLELPLLGPSTTRDAWGSAVDTAMNPIRHLLQGDARRGATAITVGSALGERDALASFIDPILYDSADSYAQTRLTYLQNRRFELGGSSAEDDFFDPFADADFLE